MYENVWALYIATTLSASSSTRGRSVPSSQYLCQVGLDLRPLLRPHWASARSRDPVSSLLIGCGLLPTLSDKRKLALLFLEKKYKKVLTKGGVSFPTKIEVVSRPSWGWRLIETKMFQRTMGDSCCQRVLLNSGKCRSICLIFPILIQVGE